MLCTMVKHLHFVLVYLKDIGFFLVCLGAALQTLAVLPCLEMLQKASFFLSKQVSKVVNAPATVVV